MLLSTLRSFQTAFAFVLAFGPLPISADDEASPPSVTNPPIALQRLRYPALLLERDPFQPPASLVSGPAPTGAADLLSNPGFALPPNAGAFSDEGSVRGAAGVSVRAVVVGATPEALLQIGTRTQFVGIGSRVGGSLVVHIDAHGVLLEDGTRFSFLQSSR